MGIQDLEIGDYIIIQFKANVRPQLAEVSDIDIQNNKAVLLPECQTDTITISRDDQWEHVVPCPIVCQVLHALGFSEVSVEKAYGWTANSWSKVSYNGRYIFNLEYTDNAWTLNILWIESGESKSASFRGIQYIHELQQELRKYN